MADKVLAALAKAADGLLYPSEADAPFDPFAGSGAATQNTVAMARRFAGLKPDIKGRPISIDDFFGDLMEEEAFRFLLDAISSILSDVKVYQFGSIEVTYVIVGRASDGRLAGLKTTSVET